MFTVDDDDGKRVIDFVYHREGGGAFLTSYDCAGDTCNGTEVSDDDIRDIIAGLKAMLPHRGAK